MGKLTNKVAVVTGAAKGIGAGIAKALAAEGASVVVNYAASQKDADNVVKAITEKGGKAVAVKGNVGNPADVESVFAEAKRAFGQVDVLVNNAGIYRFSPVGQITVEDFQQQFGTNVLGVLLATQEAVKHFPSEGGSIINISSVVSKITPPGMVVYNATKGAVDAITETLAKELGSKKIRVNNISPGVVETEGTQAAGIIGSDFQKQVEGQAPLGRIAQVEDINPIAVFLASADSGWLTGETLIASGGIR